jgi:hypothetical protein
MDDINKVGISERFGIAQRAGRFLTGKSLAVLAKETKIPRWRLEAFETGELRPTVNEFGLIWSCLSSDPPPRPPATPKLP